MFGVLAHTSFDLADAISRPEGIRFINTCHEGGGGITWPWGMSGRPAAQASAWYPQFDAPAPVIHAGEFRAIGTAFATALGAKLGQPKKRVVCVTRDDSFMMEQQELATARLHRIPVLVVVLRNNAYGVGG
jgi:thiamine pyrophosphate-dependent acetolactate synthase large subunit-like protein